MTDFTFIPVVVNRGRKFKGPAFDIGGGYTSSYGYADSGVCPLKLIEKERLWDPLNKKVVYVNADYLEPRQMTDEELAIAKAQYVNDTIQSTIKWCMSKTSSEAEGKKFARNCLLKNHPELGEQIDKFLPDERDVISAVEKTLRWAINLRTRPTVIYGKACKGGRPYGKTEIVRKAYASLAFHGYTKMEGFKEAWVFMTNMLELPNYGIELKEKGENHAT